MSVEFKDYVKEVEATLSDEERAALDAFRSRDAAAMRKPVVYLAGPYSHPDPVENTHRAIEIANDLLDVCSPFIPHLTLMWHLVTPKPYETWLALDRDHVSVCDALFRFDGESSGADSEVVLALELGIPVFYNECELREWAACWKP